MRSIMLASLAGAVLAATTLVAGAMPAAPATGSADAPSLTLVSGGCGPAAHRDFRGFCRPNGFFRGPFVRRGYDGDRRYEGDRRYDGDRRGDFDRHY